jgi:hypothetical protein
MIPRDEKPEPKRKKNKIGKNLQEPRKKRFHFNSKVSR